MNLTPDEQTLINCLRSLTFEEVLESTFAIDSHVTRERRRFKNERNTSNILVFSSLITSASEAYKKEVSILDQD